MLIEAAVHARGAAPLDVLALICVVLYVRRVRLGPDRQPAYTQTGPFASRPEALLILAFAFAAISLIPWYMVAMGIN